MASIALPSAMVVTRLRVKAVPTPASLKFLHGLAVISVIQWCLVLAIFGLLPVMIWR
jgi:hypothetical protein